MLRSKESLLLDDNIVLSIILLCQFSLCKGNLDLKCLIIVYHKNVSLSFLCYTLASRENGFGIELSINTSKCER